MRDFSFKLICKGLYWWMYFLVSSCCHHSCFLSRRRRMWWLLNLTIQWWFTLLCNQEIIHCNLESCSWEIWMGTFIPKSFPWMTTENFPAFDRVIVNFFNWSWLKPTFPYLSLRGADGWKNIIPSDPFAPMPPHFCLLSIENSQILMALKKTFFLFTLSKIMAMVIGSQSK